MSVNLFHPIVSSMLSLVGDAGLNVYEAWWYYRIVTTHVCEITTFMALASVSSLGGILSLRWNGG